MTTAPVAPTVAPPTAPLHERIMAIITEQSDSFLERREPIYVIWVTFLAGKNGFVLGPPGTAKTLLFTTIGDHVDGLEVFDCLMDRQLPKEELFGPNDLQEYETTGQWVRQISGYLPTCHLAFLDEAGKAGPTVLNPMLRILNDKTYRHGKHVIKVPLLSGWAASNELFEPELEALYDRFLPRIVVDYLQEPGNFTALMARDDDYVAHNKITLDELLQAMAEVKRVQVPPGVIDNLYAIKVKLEAEQIVNSDRRYKQSVALLKASAWLNGRSVVDDDDLSILQHVLWHSVTEIPTVQKVVLATTSEFTKFALEQDALLDEIETELNKRAGQALVEKAAYGGEASFKLSEVGTRLTDQIEKARRKGKSTTRLEGVKDRVQKIKRRVMIECLGTPGRV